MQKQNKTKQKLSHWLKCGLAWFPAWFFWKDGCRGPILTNVRWQLSHPLSGSGWLWKAFYFAEVTWLTSQEGSPTHSRPGLREGPWGGLRGLGWEKDKLVWPSFSQRALGRPALSDKPRGQRTLYVQGLVTNILGSAGYVVLVAYWLIFL